MIFKKLIQNVIDFHRKNPIEFYGYWGHFTLGSVTLKLVFIKKVKTSGPMDGIHGRSFFNHGPKTIFSRSLDHFLVHQGIGC